MELKITVKAPWDCPELTTFGMKYSAAKPTAVNAPTPMPYLSHLATLEFGLLGGLFSWSSGVLDCSGKFVDVSKTGFTKGDEFQRVKWLFFSLLKMVYDSPSTGSLSPV